MTNTTKNQPKTHLFDMPSVIAEAKSFYLKNLKNQKDKGLNNSFGCNEMALELTLERFTKRTVLHFIDSVN